jgi:hypothetical protein
LIARQVILSVSSGHGAGGIAIILSGGLITNGANFIGTVRLMPMIQHGECLM